MCYNNNVKRGQNKVPERQKERKKIMKKIVYRVFNLNPCAMFDERNGQYKDFDTLTEAVAQYNTARNYFDRDIDVIEKTFDPETFTYTETRTDRINARNV